MRIELEGGPLDLKMLTVTEQPTEVAVVIRSPTTELRWTYNPDEDDPTVWYADEFPTSTAKETRR